MITLSIILISSVLIYLVWNQYELFKQLSFLSENKNEFDVKLIEKIAHFESEIKVLKNRNGYYDGRIFSTDNHIEVLNKSLKDTSKYLSNLEKKVRDIEKAKLKKIDISEDLIDRINIIEMELSKTNKIVATFKNDILDIRTKKIDIDICNSNYEYIKQQLNNAFEFDDIYGEIICTKKDYQNHLRIKELENEIDKLKMITSSPAFESYKTFVAELESHKQKIRTSKGRVRLDKQLIENMIADGKLEIFKSYTFADLQTILMEYLQCKKVSTSSKIFRLTEKGLLKRYISEVGSLWSVNI